jgi:AcrR family transcriptional regulator
MDPGDARSLDGLTGPGFCVTIGDMKGEGIRSAKRPYRMVARAEAARATANRVLDVALELFTDRPYEDVSVEEIAQRAEVTKRTVLRRFGSKEALFLAAMERGGREEMQARDEASVRDVPAAVANVVAHYERWGANRLRLLSQEDRIAVVAEDVEIGRRYHWSWVERTFAPLIAGLKGAARRRRIAALVALTDVYTWKLLRRDLGLSQAETERTLAELIHKLEGEL